MDGHLEQVAASGERLVDRVRDHLVGEVVEASRARRADVHARPFPDRLESLEDSDVLCGVSCFCHLMDIKRFCKFAAICGLTTVLSETEVGRALREAQSDRSLHPISQLFVLDPGRQLGRPLQGFRGRLGDVRPRLCRRLGGAGSGRWPTANRNAFGALSPSRSESFARGSRARVARARTPTRTTRCSRAASRRARSGPATRSRPPSARPPRARPRPARASRLRARTSRAPRGSRRRARHRSTGHHHPRRHLSSCAGSPGNASAVVEVISVWPRPATCSISTRRRVADRVRRARRRGAAAEHRLGARSDQRRLGQEQREHGRPLLPLGAERAKVACRRTRSRRREDAAPAPVAPAFEVALQPRFELPLRDGGSPSYESRASGQPERAGRTRQTAGQQPEQSRCGSTSAAPSPAICSVHGAIVVRSPNFSAAFRWASAAA